MIPPTSCGDWTVDFDREGNRWNLEYVAVPRNHFLVQIQRLRGLHSAAELRTDLIIMATDGPDGFLDALRGTTSERVLRKARCPVANLPVGSMLG